MVCALVRHYSAPIESCTCCQGVYLWNDGTQNTDYFRWDRNQPGGSNQKQAERDCVRIRGGTGNGGANNPNCVRDGSWADRDCSSSVTQAYICERTPTC